jgi:pteridine reductase
MGLTELKGQTALITGAARRVGRRIALALADRGVSVFVHYNSSGAGAESLSAEIRDRGVQAWPLQGSLENPDRIGSMWEQALDRSPGGRISLLVNNASIFPSDTLHTLEREDLDRSLGVNALAPLQLIRLFAAQQGPGSVVNLLDSRIGGYMKRHVSYALSKRMLFSLTRMLALELAPGVRVNAVAPGMILAPEGAGGEELDRLAARSPLGRWGDPEDVAGAVLFLLENDYITGQVIFADGGAFMKESLYG